MQIGENVVVLIIFFFLLVIAVVFYAGIQKSKSNAKTIEYQSLSLLDLKTMVAALPELLCTENSDVTDGCVDAINAKAMADYWQSIKGNPSLIEREYYRHRFGSSLITVKRFDALNNAWKDTWVIYNETGNLSSYDTAYLPVSIYNITQGSVDFGEIEVRAYK